MRAMRETIEGTVGEDGIIEERDPFLDGAVARDDRRRMPFHYVSIHQAPSRPRRLCALTGLGEGVGLGLYSASVAGTALPIKGHADHGGDCLGEVGVSRTTPLRQRSYSSLLSAASRQ